VQPHPLLAGLRPGDELYFVHSYYLAPSELRFAYARIQTLAPEAMAKHCTDWPEVFGEFGQEVALARKYLGTSTAVFDKAIERIGQLKHHGVSAAQCVANEEAGTTLYDEVQAALVDLDLEEEAIGRALKQLDPVLDGLRQRPT